MHLGCVGETTSRVEEAVRTAIEMRHAAPFLRGHPRRHDDTVRPGTRPLQSGQTDYAFHIGSAHLEAVARKQGPH
ncbi:MAG: hypothetical protein FJX25_17770 [Alphaproteobacteria bacterium]|nr:hypothetical protein [Alphaproteobacteria bacterium]